MSKDEYSKYGDITIIDTGFGFKVTAQNIDGGDEGCGGGCSGCGH